jgi:hypothetical protein
LSRWSTHGGGLSELRQRRPGREIGSVFLTVGGEWGALKGERIVGYYKSERAAKLAVRRALRTRRSK